ncbi:MAG: NAD(P)H-hydrate dehydratase, partial [Bacteroidales bacterium]|nr:NAD(P)H-hydrate dehydratase [Bacteroidales bacterium]
MTPIDQAYLQARLLGREKDTHKRHYGHLLIVAGCDRMPGAAVLATGAALQSGCGLVTLHSTERALQSAVNNYPSAMLSEDPEDHFCNLPENIHKFSVIAVGPGLGRAPGTMNALLDLLLSASSHKIPMVIDADALTTLSVVPDWPDLVPPGSILTPHMGELRRLLPNISEENRVELARELCAYAGCTLVMKGYHTRVYTPDGRCLVNQTGGPSLAKGGSGDVLTGLIGGLLARGYFPDDAAALGVWIHGYAGDCLAAERTEESFSSRDIADCLWKGFKQLYKT